MRFSTHWDRRKGVAGILSAVILFVLLFTVGAGIFLTATNDQQIAANAYSERLSSQAQASHESLSMKVGSGTEAGAGYLWLMVNNTGGVDSAVSSIYVSALSGKMLSHSNSTNSPFLSGTADLNVSLPVTLDPGASTSKVGGDIQILPTALPACVHITSVGCGGQTVFVNVLTKLGNVFSVSYPTLSSVTLKNVLVDQTLIDEYLASQSVSVIGETNVVGSCFGCMTGNSAGGNILVLLLTATPSPVGQGGTITVTATVSDYSAYAADQVAVTLNATYTGSATVTPNIAPTASPNYKCGSIQSISSGDSATVTCTFSANEGTLGGGTVTFVGEAAACILTGNSVNPPCSTLIVGTPATSSVTSSNPVQVGISTSFGLWQPNFYFFYYTGCSGGSCEVSPSCPVITDGCGAGVVPDSETYVAFYVSVTNVGSTPLTLLDGSYIQSVSPNVEFDLFMGCSGQNVATCNLNGVSTGASYGVSSGTFNAYGCADSAPSPPVDSVSGQSCVTINQGQAATLMFVAAAPDSTTWTCATVGSGLCGGTGGDQAAILLDFAACTSSASVCSSGGGTYVATTSQIPFEGIVVP